MNDILLLETVHRDGRELLDRLQTGLDEGQHLAIDEELYEQALSVQTTLKMIVSFLEYPELNLLGINPKSREAGRLDGLIVSLQTFSERIRLSLYIDETKGIYQISLSECELIEKALNIIGESLRLLKKAS